MADRARFDQNLIHTLTVVSSADNATPVTLWADPTTHALVVNASVSLAKDNIPASALTQAVAVQIVDGSGNQISSFGGGTQYTDGGTPPAHPVGPTLQFNNAGTWNTVGSATPLPVTGSLTVGGTTDNSAFTAGTSTGTPTMGFYHSVIDTVTDGRAAAVAITNKRAMFVNLQTAAGAEVGTAGAPLRVDPTGSTIQPVSGTVTANAGSGNFTVVNAGTFAVQAAQSGTWNITNISGTVSLPTGAATEATLAKLPLAQASTTSGQNGPLIQGAVTTGAPTYTTAQTNPLSLTTAGALRIDGSGSTQPISGTVTANAGTGNFTVVNGGTFAVQATLSAETTKVIGTVNQGTSPWIVAGSGTAGSAASGVMTIQGIASMTPVQVSQATAASLNATVVGTGTFAVQAAQSGTWTVQPGNTPNTVPWLFTPNDGTNSQIFLADNTDAVAPSATANKPSVVGRTYLFASAAATWERARRIENALNTTGSGVTAAGMVAQFDDVSPTAITENQFGAVRISANRNVYQTIRDAAGNERGVNVTAGNALTVDASATIQPISFASNSATGSAVPVNGVYEGLQARTSNPTAASNGNLVGATADKLGKQVVVGSIRDLKGDAALTLTSSTAETTLIAQVAAIFVDVYGIIVANTSATGCEVVFRDTTAGTPRFSIEVPAGDTRGFMLPESAAYKQATVNTNWTAQAGTSVASIKINALYVQNI